MRCLAVLLDRLPLTRGLYSVNTPAMSSVSLFILGCFSEFGVWPALALYQILRAQLDSPRVIAACCLCGTAKGAVPFHRTPKQNVKA